MSYSGISLKETFNASDPEHWRSTTPVTKSIEVALGLVNGQQGPWVEDWITSKS